MRDIDWNNVYGHPADPEVMVLGMLGIARYGPLQGFGAMGRNTPWMGDADHVLMYHTLGWRLSFRGITEGFTLRDPSGREADIPLFYTGGSLNMQAWRLAEAVMRHGWPT